MAEGPRFTTSFTEAVSCGEAAGPCQPTVLRRVEGQREEFLRLADPQHERREEGSLGKLGGRRSGREGRGLLEVHQRLRDGRSNQSKPLESLPFLESV